MRQVTIDGKRYKLRFDWDALREVNQKHGDGPNMLDPEIVASVASIGMKAHPEMTPEKIRELSPPLVPFANAVQEALQWAYFGDEGLPKDTGEKKSPILAGLCRPFRWLAGMGSTR